MESIRGSWPSGGIRFVEKGLEYLDWEHYLSSLASRLSEQNAHSSHTHLYSFFKSILKKRVSMALAHQVCVNHSRMRHSILTRVLNNTVTTSEPTTSVILDAEECASWCFCLFLFCTFRFFFFTFSVYKSSSSGFELNKHWEGQYFGQTFTD